jgi:hypothetical protein
MYESVFSVLLDKKLAKLSKKNRSQLVIIDKKIESIRKNPLRYKQLREDMK